MSTHERLDRIVQAGRRTVERWLPWYDVADERRRTARTEAIRRRAIHTRIRTEQRLAALGISYRRADDDLRRRR